MSGRFEGGIHIREQPGKSPSWIELTKNADFNKHKYSEYGIGFDVHGSFSLSNGNGFSQNVIIFGADMSSSAYVGNR